jgi:hypothetical protein
VTERSRYDADSARLARTMGSQTTIDIQGL